MKFEDVKRAILAACDDLITREIELSELDALVGDGDHGVTIRKGYRTVKNAIETEDPKTISEIFQSAGYALADTAGGAIGPILASMRSKNSALPISPRCSRADSRAFRISAAQSPATARWSTRSIRSWNP